MTVVNFILKLNSKANELIDINNLPERILQLKKNNFIKKERVYLD